MSDLAHLFGLGCLIIVGRAAPGLLFETVRRGMLGGTRASALLRRLRQAPASTSSDLSLEQAP